MSVAFDIAGRIAKEACPLSRALAATHLTLARRDWPDPDACEIDCNRCPMNDEDKITRSYEVSQVEFTVDVSYADFTRAFESLLGRMDARALTDLPQMPAEKARAKLQTFVGPLDFSLFQKIDHGAIVASLYGRHAHAMTYVFGNALIAVEMTKHDLRAGLHVPLRLFVAEAGDGHVRVTYDRPSSLIASLGSAEANAVARELDVKVERLLRETVARATAS
jgi:uncharacterized protein (DUF302 family)